MELTDEVAGRALVADGIGITLLPSLFLDPGLTEIAAVPLRPTATRRLHLVTRASQRDHAVKGLAEELLDASARLTRPWSTLIPR